MSSVWEMFRVFLRLGCTSFGGPIAHIGYFRAEFVERRRWIDDAAYADLVALCQFLPGPASSQVGFAIGLRRAGYLGALAAWVGFTVPSAALLIGFALGAPSLQGRFAEGALHGLKLAAVAVVAQAVLGMARTLTPDFLRATIAVLALAAMAFVPGGAAQDAAIALGGIAGLMFCHPASAPVLAGQPSPVSRRAGSLFLAVFAVGLALSFLPFGGGLALFDAFYRSGALVFGGGHVVLPLLRATVVDPGYVSDAAFLQGYGAAQAVPGPLFSVGGYLGAVANIGPGGVAGGLVALVALFLPGMLALMGALPFWHELSASGRARAAMAGLNAAVVGLLAAALYDPVFISAVHSEKDFVVAAAGFVGLVVGRASPLFVVLFCAVAGLALAALN